MLLQIQERHIEPDTTVLELAGKLALGRESQRVEMLVDELVKKSARKVIFDMTHVDYIDSAGIGLLALATGKIKAAGGKLVVVTGPGKVLDMLKLTQMIAVVTAAARWRRRSRRLAGSPATLSRFEPERPIRFAFSGRGVSP
jgi:anti-sigma B factor antagonist